MNERSEVARYTDDRQVLPQKLTDEAIDRIVENMAAWEKFKQRALSKRDKSQFGDNEYIEKSGWVKVAMAMNVSFRLIAPLEKVPSHDDEGEYYLWHVRGEATTPSGRVIQMDGACTSRDEFFSMKRDAEGQPVRRKQSEIDEKDILATCETNAFNRCMAFLFGFGEVSADEMRGKQFSKKGVTFPFPDEWKGKSPADLDLASLHKALGMFTPLANDPKNKFADTNKRLVAAIQEAIAEKTAKPPTASEPRPAAAEVAPESGLAAQAIGADAEPSPLDAAWIMVKEAREAKQMSRDQVMALIGKTWPSLKTKGGEVDLTKMDLLMVQNLALLLGQE